MITSRLCNPMSFGIQLHVILCYLTRFIHFFSSRWARDSTKTYFHKMDQLSSGQGKANYLEFYVYLFGANKSLNAKCNKGTLLALLSLILINDIGSSISLSVAYLWHLLTLSLRRNEWIARIKSSYFMSILWILIEIVCSIISNVLRCMSYGKETLCLIFFFLCICYYLEQKEARSGLTWAKNLVWVDHDSVWTPLLGASIAK